MASGWESKWSGLENVKTLAKGRLRPASSSINKDFSLGICEGVRRREVEFDGYANSFWEPGTQNE